MEWGRKLLGIILLLLCMFILVNDSFHSYINIPETLTVYESEWQTNEKDKLIKEKLRLTGKNHIQVTAEGEDQSAAIKVAALPKKRTSIKTIPDLKVVPGGDSIGVKLQSDGVMVVGFHDVNDGNNRFSPAKKAGVESGDRIVQMNDKQVKKSQDVIQYLENNKDTVQLKVKRDGDLKTINVNPHQKDNKSVLGAYIRNTASGVGTLSFYDPRSGKYGALGHVIADATTKKPIVVENGKVLRSSVTSIDKGENGNPGEKQASFSTENEELGKVEKNTSFGVFGKLNPDQLSEKKDEIKPMPVAFADEVKKGPAEMLTVLEGEEIERFDIEILQTIPQIQAASKGMVIKVTDEKLLEQTNGIIQGMSGSPIIQDGKLVGAVTHVFVNDSTSGYACHIEWMLDEAGIDTLKKQRQERETAA